MPTIEWKQPSPGSWERESHHMTRPLSRWSAAVYPKPSTKGFREGAARYGLLLDRIEFQTVNGFMYLCPRPIGAPPEAKGTPPRLVFAILAKLHPEMRKRIRRCEEVFRARIWREEVRRWDEETKPLFQARYDALEEEDPRALSDADLAAHHDEVRAALEAGLENHHALNPCCMVAVGDFLAHAAAWTGRAPGELVGLLRGSSPVSLGAAAELEALAAALRGDASARALADGDPAQALSSWTARDDEIGEAARALVDGIGLRTVTGIDVADLCVHEMPQLLVNAVRGALDGRAGARTLEDHERRMAELRAAVPETHRATFDELLAEARLVMRIRDERGLLSEYRTVAIARRMLLEVGRRLVERGLIDRADHAFELLPDDVRPALLHGRAPPRAELAFWAMWREEKTIADAPPWLGSEPGKPPPPEWLPGEAARTARAMATLLALMFDKETPVESSAVLKGLPVSPGQVEGTARVVLTPADFGRVQKGDVLIARLTTPAYNVLLPVLSGIVTDRGGLLSHTAIVAREYGLPAVVATQSATSSIKDGARVRLDGTTGEVRVLA